MRSRIGYVPQLAGVPTDVPLTAREVVVTGRSARAGLWHRLTRADWRAAQEWLDRLGLGAMGGRVFAELSGGEQRKVLIARAMVHDPELLLLDEPTAFLDLGWREQIVRVMETLHADRRLTLLVVCHEPEVLPACCDRVMLLDHGRVAAEGPAGQVLTDAHVEGWYGQELSIVQHAGRFGVVARSLAAGLSAAAGGRPLTSCAAPSAAGGRPLTSCAAPSAAAPSTAPSTAPADPQPGGQSPRP